MGLLYIYGPLKFLIDSIVPSNLKYTNIRTQLSHQLIFCFKQMSTEGKTIMWMTILVIKALTNSIDLIITTDLLVIKKMSPYIYLLLFDLISLK